MATIWQTATEVRKELQRMQAAKGRDQWLARLKAEREAPGPSHRDACPTPGGWKWKDEWSAWDFDAWTNPATMGDWDHHVDDMLDDLPFGFDVMEDEPIFHLSPVKSKNVGHSYFLRPTISPPLYYKTP